MASTCRCCREALASAGLPGEGVVRDHLCYQCRYAKDSRNPSRIRNWIKTTMHRLHVTSRIAEGDHFIDDIPCDGMAPPVRSSMYSQISPEELRERFEIERRHDSMVKIG